MSVLRGRLLFASLALLALTPPAFAAEGKPLGEKLGLAWSVPFLGLLLSIALLPLLAPGFWRDQFGKVAFFWAALFLVPFAVAHGVGTAGEELLDVTVSGFVPLVILLWAVYTVAGGLRLRGRLRGTPMMNTCLLVTGTILASWIGTAAAAMVLIRPLIRANAWRKKKTHLIVFFIFLVANIGGALTPLGSRPLLLGYERGVPFFWTAEAMLFPMLVCVGVLLALFFLIDHALLRREVTQEAPDDGSNEPIGLEGSLNLIFLVGIVAAVLYSGLAAKSETYWDQGQFDRARGRITAAETELATISLRLRGAAVEDRVAMVEEFLATRSTVTMLRAAAAQDAVKGWRMTEDVVWPLINVVRDGVLVMMGVLSLLLTSRGPRRKNGFTWFPVIEMGKLFAAIFVTLIPVIAVLKVGTRGEFGPLAAAATGLDGQPVNAMYFWLTGALSSFLDTAPTHLAFIDMAGGDPSVLATDFPGTLLGISAGAVFMSALTYIGSAHNLMVRSIAEEAGVTMPSFFGYALKWSLPILVPIFCIVSLIWS